MHPTVKIGMDRAGRGVDVSVPNHVSDDDFASITSSVIDYEFENGRRYHAFKAGSM